MSAGLSVALPLGFSNIFGAYNLNTTFFELAKQNLKMLILTVPGERIMDPRFGVGLKKYLFEMNDDDTYDNITEKILEQTKIYLPYIKIQDILYGIPEDNPDLYPHNLSVKIIFMITPLQLLSNLYINVEAV
tara:strand:+ start:28775 stop:29170 length:396 start_codon:yes stop_codon:yes gene_type:complete